MAISPAAAEPFWLLYAREHIDVEGEKSKKQQNEHAAPTATAARPKPHRRFKLPKTTPTTFEFTRPLRSELAAADNNPRDYGIQAQLALRVEPPLIVRGASLKSFVRALGSVIRIESHTSLRIVRTQANPFLVFVSAASDELLTQIQDAIVKGNVEGRANSLALVVGDEEKLVTFHSLRPGANVQSLGGTSREVGKASSPTHTLKVLALPAQDKQLLISTFKACCKFYGDTSALLAEGVLQALRRAHSEGIQLGFSTAMPTMVSMRRWYRSANLPHDAKLELRAFLQVAAVAFSEADHERKRLAGSTARVAKQGIDNSHSNSDDNGSAGGAGDSRQGAALCGRL
jgi:hypothetical protein